jgi:flagellar biosynthetic protein FliR
MLGEILTLNIFAFMLVFARVGTALFILPGFAGTKVNVRARLAIAVTISFLVTPLLAAKLPSMPGEPMVLLVLIAGEMVAGGVVATVPLILMAAVHTAGTIIAFVSAMANSLIFDPISQQQSAIVAGFLSTTAALLLFVTEMHHLFIRAILDSYLLFQPGVAMNFGDTLHLLARHVADSFKVGLQLAAPFLIMSATYNLGLGVLTRLAPQIPSFFVIMPLQIAVGMMLLMITVPGIMFVAMNHIENGVIFFIAP